jgi:hypothetical protein
MSSARSALKRAWGFRYSATGRSPFFRSRADGWPSFIAPSSIS